MDRDILRSLAGQIAEIAALDVQKKNADMYRALNSLKPVRPVVLIDELPWNQLEVTGELELKCEDEYLRSVEREMRRILYKWNHCRCDMIVEPFWRVNVVAETPQFFGVSVKEETLATDEGNNIISHHYVDQITCIEDLEKFQEPVIHVDRELTEKRRQILDGIFGDILPVQIHGNTWGGFFHPWDDLARMRGVQNILYDLYDEPEFMHAFMRKYTDLSLKLLKKQEELGLLDGSGTLIHCTAGLTNELGAKTENVTRADVWGRGAAQIFSEVSPAMHDEYDIAYQKEFFKGFNLVYYGCCEPLHNKIDIVEKIPNVRKISITPWANVTKAAEVMGSRYVLARKPNPALVANPTVDEAVARRDILETLDACRANGTPCEFTLKDISSVSYKPQNLDIWAKIAMETVLNY
jgi:hypothetical protein